MSSSLSEIFWLVYWHLFINICWCVLLTLSLVQRGTKSNLGTLYIWYYNPYCLKLNDLEVWLGNYPMPAESFPLIVALWSKSVASKRLSLLLLTTLAPPILQVLPLPFNVLAYMSSYSHCPVMYCKKFASHPQHWL